ncbi:hypothetical protein NBRC10512_006234 [Rhodotorula toruloides]
MPAHSHPQLALIALPLPLSQADSSCGSGSSYNGNLDLRVGGLFLILVRRMISSFEPDPLGEEASLGTSAIGTLFPILCRRSRLRISEHVYTAFKFFGSGVIIATAFIHLLAPAFQALGSDCLHGAWKDYEWAPAIAMIAVFGIFLVELVATRTGASYLKRRGLRHHDPHHVRGNEVGHTGHGTHPPADTTTTALASSGTSVTQVEGAAAAVEANEVDLEAGEAKANQRHDHGVLEEDDDLHESAVAQCIGVGILEIGVIFHSFIIGLTLAVSNNLGPLLAVLTFHQTFEGIGLGSRLSSLPLPHRLNWVPIVAAVVYSCTTPLGIAVGLGVRETYNPDSAAASIVSGILDASSAGILLWAGLVECLAHDLVFDRKMAEAPPREVAVAVFWVFLGAGLMALLGRWA